MKKFGLVAVVCFLVAGCSGGQDRTVVFDDDEAFLRGLLVSDGKSVWGSVDSKDIFDGLDGSAEVIKLDAATANVEWREQYGIGTSDDLVLVDGKLWAFAWEPLPPDTISDGEVVVRVDPASGEVIDQKVLPSAAYNSVVVNDVVWTLGVDPNDVYVHDVESLELVDTIQTSTLRTPEGSFFRNLESMTLLGEKIWISDGRDLLSIDATTFEMVDFVDPDDFGLDILEVHDGLLWVGKSDKPDEGTFSYDPETGEMTPSGLYESPIGNKYHDGYTYDVIDPTTVAQINTETGEQVATFTDLNPFSIVITDGYLWAHDRNQIFRYETKP